MNIDIGTVRKDETGKDVMHAQIQNGDLLVGVSYGRGEEDEVAALLVILAKAIRAEEALNVPYQIEQREVLVRG